MLSKRESAALPKSAMAKSAAARVEQQLTNTASQAFGGGRLQRRIRSQPRTGAYKGKPFNKSSDEGQEGELLLPDSSTNQTGLPDKQDQDSDGSAAGSEEDPELSSATDGSKLRVIRATLEREYSRLGHPSRKTYIPYSLNEDANKRCSIQVANGRVVRNLDEPARGNAVRLNNYVGAVGVLKFGYDVAFTLDHLILLFNCALCYYAGRTRIDEYSEIITTLVISALVTSLMNLLADRKWSEAARQINSKPVERFVFNRSGTSFQITDWGSVQQGDILKVRRNQEMPADVLILNVHGSKTRDQTCYARGGFFDQKNNPQLKYSYTKSPVGKSGKSRAYQKLIDKLSGTIKWEFNNFGHFAGVFQHKDTPAVFELLQEHIMQRGCYVLDADHVLCLALNVGTSCMGNLYKDPSKDSVWQMMARSSDNRSHFESVHFAVLKYVQIASMVMCLIPCLVLIFEELVLRNEGIRMFVQSHADAEYTYCAQQFTGLYTDFMLNHPYLAKITMEAVIFLHAYFSLWDVNLVPAQLNYNQMKIMKSMGQIDSVVCSKSAFFQQNTSFVGAFQVAGAVFHRAREDPKNTTDPLDTQFSDKPSTADSQGDGEERDRAPSDLGEASYDGQFAAQLESLPISVELDYRFHHPDAYSLLSGDSPESRTFKGFLAALVLTHHSPPIQKSRPYHTKLFDSLYKEEEAQLYFARSFGYVMTAKKDGVMTVRNQQQDAPAKYTELFINRITFGDEFLTVSVIKPEKGDGRVSIYYRGPLKIIMDFLPLSQAAGCERAIGMFQQGGLHAWGVAEAVLDQAAGEEFVGRLLEKRHAFADEARSAGDKLVLAQAKDCKLLGIYCLQLVFNQRDALVIDDLKKNGMKLYVMSQEPEDCVITDCYALNIFAGYDPAIRLKGDSESAVERSLRQCIKECIRRQNLRHKVGPADGPPTDKPASKSSKERYDRMNSREGFSHHNHHRIRGSHSPRSRHRRSDLGTDELLSERSYSDKTGQFDDKLLQDDCDSRGTGQEKNILIFDGVALQFILTDETLKTMFLTLCSLCSVSIGSNVSPHQRKFVVRAIREFAIQGKLGNVVSIIAQQADKFQIEESDISIGVTTRFRQSDVLACTDIQMNNLYGLTYLFFKHGTLAHRRSKIVLLEFIQRTVMTQTISIFYFLESGFTYVLPYGPFFFSFFMAVQTPIQFWMEGISHIDYGYDIVHRIQGEYRSNLMTKIEFFELGGLLFHGVADACIFWSIYLFAGVAGDDHPVDYANGSPVSMQSYLIVNAVSLSIINIFRARSDRNSVVVFAISNYVFFFLSLMTALEDEHLQGVLGAVRCPYIGAFLTFITLCIILKHFFIIVYTQNVGYYKRMQAMYQEIENQIFMEEYENPEKQYSIDKLESYIECMKLLDYNNLYSINKNLMTVHSSEALDEIVQNLNNTYSQEPDKNNGYEGKINKYNLRLHDINKEFEYTRKMKTPEVFDLCLPSLWNSLVLYFSLLCFKVFNSWIVSTDVSFMAQSDGISTKLDTKGSQIMTVYFELAQIVMSVVGIYAIKRRFKWSYFLILLLIIAKNMMIIVKFYFDRESPLVQVQFLYTLAFSFGCRLHSVYVVSIICLISSTCYLNIRMSVINEHDLEDHVEAIQHNFQLSLMTIGIVSYLFLWIHQAYIDEIYRKLDFQNICSMQKQFQKLKSIQKALVPQIVRQKGPDYNNFNDNQMGDVTVAVVQLTEFDQLCEKYTDERLFDLVESIFSAFDDICAREGLESIVTTGPTYVCVGGHQFCENEVEKHLTNKNHAVRVADFASSALEYINNLQHLEDSSLHVRIGIDTGPDIVGIVGDMKPQFTLIGNCFNKCQNLIQLKSSEKILISKNSYESLRNQVQSFDLVEQMIFSEGKIITCYSIRERMVGKKFELNSPSKKTEKQRAKVVKHNSQHEVGDKSLQMSFQDYDCFKENPLTKIKQQDASQSFQALDSLREFNEDIKSEDQLRHKQNISGYLAEKEEDDFVNEFNSDNEDSQYEGLSKNISDKRIFDDFKDDRAIVKKAAQNDQYKLVERPKFLLGIESRDWEGRYATVSYNKNYSVDFCNFVAESIFEIMLIQVFVYSKHVSHEVYFMVGAGHTVFKLILFLVFKKMKSNRHVIAALLHYSSLLFTIVIFALLGPINKNIIYRESQLITFAIFLMFAFKGRSLQFKELLIFTILIFMILLVQNYWHIEQRTIDIRTYITDSVLTIILATYFIQLIHRREMDQRISYNKTQIMDVEIKKAEGELKSMVPEYVVKYFESDMQQIDEVKGVTFLNLKVTHMSEFCAKVMPQEMLSLVNRVYGKFDQLCEHHGIYKLNTLGDNYCAMGFTGNKSLLTRSDDDIIEEASKTILVAFQMYEIVKDEKNRQGTSFFKDIDVKIGLHHGNSLAGVINRRQYTKYDVLGKEMLKAALVVANCCDSMICISEDLVNLIKNAPSNKFTFKWQMHKTVQLSGDLKSPFQLYKIDKKYLQAESCTDRQNRLAPCSESERNSPLMQSLSPPSTVYQEVDGPKKRKNKVGWKISAQNTLQMNKMKSEELKEEEEDFPQ